MSDDRDDLLVVLTYYSPHVSGLTNATRDVAERLAARRRRVTVVTTRYDPSLPARETLNCVRVRRAPVLARLAKGVISPGLDRMAVRAARTAKVVNLHLPMLDAGLIATASSAPVVVTYHCDVSLPPSLLNSAQRAVIDASSRLAMRRASSVVVTTDDYARHSRLWRSIQPSMVAIPPPCVPCPGGVPRFRHGAGMHVGFLGRIVHEKGLEYLVDGFLALDDPDARLLIGGDFIGVAGGSVVEQVLKHARGDPRVRLLGFVPDHHLADFYASIDVLALPSVNAFEAFGIVQVVAMLAGKPVLASNLPGVRIPVRETGFGEIVEPRDVAGISDALRELGAGRLDPAAGAARAAELYDLDMVVDAYDAVFEKAALGSEPPGRG